MEPINAKDCRHIPVDFSVCYKTPSIPGMEKSHIHRELEVTMVLSDQVQCTIGSTRRTLRANTLVLFNNFERHCLNVPNESYYRHTCLFLPAFLGTDREEDPLACFFVRPVPEANLLPLNDTDAVLFRMLFEQMEGVAALPGDAYARQQELKLLLHVLLIELNRRHRAIYCRSEISGSGAFTLISQVISAIQEDLASDSNTLELLSRRFAVSRTRLASDFKAVTGTTLHQYLLDCRIWQSARLLEQGASAEEAGLAVGFQAPAHFSRCFKTRTGLSPKQYAMAHRGSSSLAPQGAASALRSAADTIPETS